MVDLFGLSAAQFETFILVFLRVTTMLYVFPIFSAPQIPTQVRFGFGLLVSYILWRIVPPVHLSNGIYDLALAGVSQVVLGMIVGFVASLVFTGIQFAGELIDLQIGFAIANVINPTTQQNVTIIGEFQLAIATLIFLATDSHYFLIQGMAGSFNLVPLPYITLDPSLAGNVTLFFTQAFLIVFRIAAPVVAALFLTNIALAFMARVAPQMNVFVIGLPLQIGVGLVMMAISLPLLATVGPELFQTVAQQMDAVMRSLHG
ncbi:MAG: flagellar type III secretion system protein FliR [Candidatus Eremiobacteraeota bacterium]|nr:flagellar type III secretion system protein FliR [Candidatus Eremiobacteraeota bacterium]